jgi:sulfatase modifying factor 1
MPLGRCAALCSLGWALLASCNVDGKALGRVAIAALDAAPAEAPEPPASPDAAELAPADAPSPDAAPDAALASPDAAAAPDVRAPDATSPPDAALSPDLTPAAPDAAGCPAAQGGPPLVRVGSFCIDATEVTNAQYEVFWRARGLGRATTGQGPACAWNGSFTPEESGGTRWPARPGDERRPVVNVDWCDAQAFCQWAGKRLCGGIERGSLPRWQDSGSATVSQWAYACASGGRTSYPYGNSYDAQACNAGRRVESASVLVDVATKTGCRTQAGVYDLSGNAEEWVDACTGTSGPGDLCAVAGASAFQDVGDDLTCAGSPYPDRRAQAYELRGFRCCAP